MEEPVRTDEKGNIVGAAMEDSFWEGATLVVKVREGVRFQDGTALTAHSVRRAVTKPPHPCRGGFQTRPKTNRPTASRSYPFVAGPPKSDLRVSSSISSSERRSSWPTPRAWATAGRDSMVSYQRFTFG